MGESSREYRDNTEKSRLKNGKNVLAAVGGTETAWKTPDISTCLHQDKKIMMLIEVKVCLVRKFTCATFKSSWWHESLPACECERVISKMLTWQ